MKLLRTIVSFSTLLAILRAAPALAQALWATDGVPVCTNTANQAAVTAASDAAGGAYVAWEDLRSGTNDIYFQHIFPFGGTEYSVSGGKAACTATGDQRRPTVLADGQHGAFVAWTDMRAVRQIYLQVVRPGGALLAADGVPAVTTAVDGGQDYASLVSAGSGQAITLDWHWGGCCGINCDYHHRSGGQKMTAVGSRSWSDAGALFAGSGCPVNEADLQMVPTGVSTGAGGVLICYDRYVAGEKNVYAKLVASDGSVTPTTGFGLVISDAVGHQRNPVVTTNSAGGAIVAWEDNRTSPTAIYAQWILANGTQVRWTANGRLLAGGTGPLANPKIAPDGAGGTYIAWEDHTTASDANLYLQHVTILGDTAAARIPLCTAVGNQGGLALVEDGAGGVLAAWWDERTGFRDVYAQHVVPAPRCGATGMAALWPANGYPVCTAGFDQDEVALLRDGHGGAIVVWRDQRAGFANADVYAQRLAGGCDPATDANPIALTAYVLAVRPNPTQGRTALEFALRGPDTIELDVYTVTGQRVRRLVHGALAAGRHEVAWDGRDEHDRATPAGVYFIRLTGERGVMERKVVRLSAMK